MLSEEKLDRLLRDLSDSEKMNHDTTGVPEWYTALCKDGEIPVLSLHRLPYGRSRVIESLDLAINRNSRFSPVPMHKHDYIEISYVYSGQCPERVIDDEILMTKGQVLIVDTNVRHSIAALGKEDILINLLMPKNYLFGNLFSRISSESIVSSFFINSIREDAEHDRYLYFKSEENRRIPMYFKELFAEFFEPSSNVEDIVRNLIALIISELMNVYESQCEDQEKKLTSQEPFIKILKYIEENFRTCTRQSVAEHFHINEKHLTNLIKKNTSMTYKQLVQSQKLKYACRLLRNTDMSINEVIVNSGYENMHFFYKKFYEEYGESPNDYRKKIVPNGQ